MKDNNNYKIIYKMRTKRFFEKIREKTANGWRDFFKLDKFSLIFISSVLSVLILVIFFIILFSSINKKFYFDDFHYTEFDNDYIYSKLDLLVEFQVYASGELSGSTQFIVKTFSVKSYSVKSGETLGAIARKFKLSLGTLINYNSIIDVRKVQVGSELQIPSINGIRYTVKNGDSIERLANKYGSDFNLICDYNNIKSDVIKVGQELFLPGVEIDDFSLNKAMGRLFQPPTFGHITSGFGYRIDPFTGRRRMHSGIDIANRLGTSIRASMSGKVVHIDRRPRGYGNYIVLRHQNGYQTLYAHLNSISVKRGMWIKSGQEVGKMGTTGRSTGVHLHFSIFRNNIALDPIAFVHY